MVGYRINRKRLQAFRKVTTMDSEDEIERKFQERFEPKQCAANVRKHEMTLSQLKADLQRWTEKLKSDPNNYAIKDQIAATETEIGHEYARLREADSRNMKAQMGQTDREAERAMLQDLHGIRRDKSDPGFEQRVERRKAQNVSK